MVGHTESTAKLIAEMMAYRMYRFVDWIVAPSGLCMNSSLLVKQSPVFSYRHYLEKWIYLELKNESFV